MYRREGAGQLGRFVVATKDARISVEDFGGTGPPALLLHGLYGGAHEWAWTASWLKGTHHVFAPDQRGHGKSSKLLGNFSIAAFVEDAVAVLTQVSEAPALVVGQSMGGVVAMLLAAKRPDLVSRVVLVECHAESNPVKSDGFDWLSKWPLPFEDAATARRFFASQGMDPDIWMQVLEHRESGYSPVFHSSDMSAINDQLSSYDYRTECGRISAPTLVIAGSRSWLNQQRTREVADLIPDARFVVLSQAGHDVHLDSPEKFRTAVSEFVQTQEAFE